MPDIMDRILSHYPTLNDQQIAAIEHGKGPLLIIAGPGSGKSLVLVLRTLYLLEHGLVEPENLLLCTFTEKAAYQLRDRLSRNADVLNVNMDLSAVNVSTIHGFCNKHLQTYRLYTNLRNKFEVLDELTQPLFIFEHFDEIAEEFYDGERYFGKWKRKWDTIKWLGRYFNRIAQELVDPEEVIEAGGPPVNEIAVAYQRYKILMYEKNRIDFAHQQREFYELLTHPEIGSVIRDTVTFVMVDEYQDTNYVQEQICLGLVEAPHNICVVGDDDQSLYRFRGASVQNILQFESNFDDCERIYLRKNYRSHKNIISAYNDFIDGGDWENSNGTNFRFDKEIKPGEPDSHSDYPSVLKIEVGSKSDEAQKVADFVEFLQDKEVIDDLNQIAILLHSVKERYSGPYREALNRRGIDTFCPRAGNYFGNEEVMLIVGCYASLLRYHGDKRGNISGYALKEMTGYVDRCLMHLARNFGGEHKLNQYLKRQLKSIDALEPGDSLDKHLLDYFYELMALPPFSDLLEDEEASRNLANFSELITVFQNYYNFTVVSKRNYTPLRFCFFNSFLRFLHSGGINEHEDPDNPFPSGHVQIMTIHQSKGLEFPVVLAGSLNRATSTAKQIDDHLSSFYDREFHEPRSRITHFDRMRLHYVAFSRPEKILALTCSETPEDRFHSIWDQATPWEEVDRSKLEKLTFEPTDQEVLKKSFSFTSDIKVYETCPRQYEYFRKYEFTPSRSAEIFFGSLVHQTIEDVHRYVLDGRKNELDGDGIRSFFEINHRTLEEAGVRPLGHQQKEIAWNHVWNYYTENEHLMAQVVETEVDVSLEKDEYILTGVIDLLTGEDGKTSILDFKSQIKPERDDERVQQYYRQLCVYGHIVKNRYGVEPDKLLLYWTGEETRDQALMEFDYDPTLVDQAGHHFDTVVDQIHNENFTVENPPEEKVCKECDFRNFCSADGLIVFDSSLSEL